MIAYDALVKHLTVVEPAPFGLLSRGALATAQLLRDTFGDRLAALFSPEHGWFGFAAAGEKTHSGTHPQWNIPVHALYGDATRPSSAQLRGLRRIVIDLPDLGVRCYTYLATIKVTLEACAEAGVAVTVLDRPVPLGGVVDGPLRELAFASFVAPLNVPLCHGMTPGEYATYIVREEGLDLDLTVIKMRGWNHNARAPWPGFLPPSPAIPSWDSAALYPATVFTEAYPAVDCDRGGPLSFRVIGAPWMNTPKLLAALREVLPACGVGVRPLAYRPAQGNYKGQTLDGLLLSIANPEAFYPVTAGTLILAALLSHHGPDATRAARPDWFDRLYGSPATREAIRTNTLSALFQSWISAQDAYLPTRINLYP